MTTIKGEKAAGLVARHIEGLILEGSLRPGESLLPERELAERLDVSRPTLRDGLKMLEERGLLTGKEGRGLKVAQLGAAAIADPLIEMLANRMEVADDYLEFRDVVESSAAAMAADRATEIDLRTLRDCLDRIDRAHAKGDPVEEADADAEFHMTIYEACHNIVILQIMRALSSNLRTDVLHNRERLFTIPFTRDLLRNQHREIGDAILGRDPEAASRAAHAHLAYLRNATREIREAEAKLGISLRRLEGGGLASRKASR
ncbi:FCD domain-containing protein [Bradyrhizobium denitrificans]|jgi:GntR family transcriptional repressor for pyruvate dehydrogenase complex